MRHNRQTVNWRKLTADDLKECLAIQPARSGAEFVSAADVLPAWRWLLRERGFSGVVVSEAAASETAACGAAIFVAREWVDQELGNPRPGLNARLIEKVIREGGQSVLNWEGVARGNAEGTLDLLILFANWRAELKPEEVSEAQMHLAMSFLELHRGYRLKRMLTEAVDSGDIAHLNSVPSWRNISTFDEWFAANPHTSFNRDRALGLVTYESCMMEPGTVAMSLFRHRQPTLGLNDNEQSLLLSALRRVSDEEIARDLHISESAVR